MPPKQIGIQTRKGNVEADKAKELHRSIKRKFERRKVISTHVDQIHSVDIVQMIQEPNAILGAVPKSSKKQSPEAPTLVSPEVATLTSELPPPPPAPKKGKEPQEYLHNVTGQPLSQKDRAKLEKILNRIRLNKGNKYILNVVDVFSRYAWSAPMKDRTSATIIETLKAMKVPRPEKMWVDEEFNKKELQDYMKSVGVETYNTYGQNVKNSIVERFNRTMKNQMFEIQTARGFDVWYNLIPAIIRDYNTTKHSTIGTTPSDARKPEYHDQLLRVNTLENDRAKGDAKLQVGDRVRVALANSTFKRGFNINWSENIHIVTAVHPTQPPTYTVSLNNVRKKGTYYEPQLLKSKF